MVRVVQIDNLLALYEMTVGQPYQKGPVSTRVLLQLLAQKTGSYHRAEFVEVL